MRTHQLAVLIDADNSDPGRVEGLVTEIAKYGRASVKRAYGNWTSPQLGGWKKALLTHSIQPVQQFSYTTGKNATDSAMIIDAMDLLYSGRFDGFCIVSSDSDFTRLAARIREQGLLVYGFGERKTPQPFVAACDRFVYTEILDADADEEGADAGGAALERPASAPTKKAARKRAAKNAAPVAAPATVTAPVPAEPATAPVKKKPKAAAGLLRRAVDAAVDDEGWAHLGAVGNLLGRLAPEFDPRDYGCRKLKDLVACQAGLEVEERAVQGGGRAVFVRVRAGSSTQ
ncbi:NYN domain-containing protein [Coralloluteibacterium stylophorae]|uniref:NYN domain-containing protein n=2 Tax=Coralloluteibacterium stylophorae TaxID=1776034 RepID=A0A8J7VX59_9GAMM|nr:NYN domain-containing protein [Coralloluteibacterium stylophorae]MBS7458558.1 NYN domain-containing protein [Coralloluteibacterium stylophorae]